MISPSLQTPRRLRVLLTSLMAFTVCIPLSSLAAPVSIEDALNTAYGENPELKSAYFKTQSEESKIGLSRSLPNPRLGVMRENNLSTDQQMMGPMDSFVISQEIMFPTKYSAMGDAQKATALSSRHRYEDLKLDIRSRTLTAYVSVISARQILALLEAQRETLRQIARIAESRRATGSAPQQDEMKAHVEQTKIENEILMQKQEIEEAEASLLELLGRAATEPLELKPTTFDPPEFKLTLKEVEEKALTNSREIAASKSMVEEATAMHRLATWSYAPDFMLSYRKPFRNAPGDAYAVELDITVPLWFFTRQSNEVESAQARTASAESELSAMNAKTRAETRALFSKSESFAKMLKVYSTALAPQAASTLSSSQSAYAAGRTTFLELLDAERSLFDVRIGYYRTLAKYIESLTRLERVAGSRLSTLPFGDEK